MSFDLNSLALKETADLHLTHPVSGELLYADGDAKKKPVTVELYGTSSKQYRQAILALQNRALKRDGKKKATAEQMREEGVSLLVACSEKINNLVYNGKPVDNDEAFRSLYSDPKFSWLREQCDAFLGDVSGFLTV